MIERSGKAHLSGKVTSEHGEADAELGEEEGGAERWWRARNRAEEARELQWRASSRPLSFWRRRGRERVERRALRSEGEDECAGGDGRRGRGHGASQTCMPSTRRCGPDAVGHKRRAVAASVRRGKARAQGPGWLRWLWGYKSLYPYD